jgi:hypothetical protein
MQDGAGFLVELVASIANSVVLRRFIMSATYTLSLAMSLRIRNSRRPLRQGKGCQRGIVCPMKRTLVLAAGVLVSLCASIPAHGAPCATTKQECTEWITLGGGPGRSLIYRTYALDEKNEKITRAMIMVHGAGRDADNYFRTAVAAAFLAGALEDAIVISPRFASNGGGCQDKLAANEISWRATATAGNRAGRRTRTAS